MVFGGIPYYLSLLDHDESHVQNVDRLFFSQDTQMRREFRRLFNTLYKKPEKYIDIIKALGKPRQGMTREKLPMITTEGMARGKYTEMIQSQITPDDLFT